MNIFDNQLNKAKEVKSIFCISLILISNYRGIQARPVIHCDSDLLTPNRHKEGKIVNEKKEGAWIYYNGEIIYRISYFKNDTLQGTTTLFYGNGKVKTQMVIINGKVEGEVNFYSTEGKLIANYLYKNDLFIKVLYQTDDKDAPIKGHNLKLLED